MNDEREDNLESTMRSIAKALWAINDKIPDKEHMKELEKGLLGIETSLDDIYFVLSDSEILTQWSADDER